MAEERGGSAALIPKRSMRYSPGGGLFQTADRGDPRGDELRGGRGDERRGAARRLGRLREGCRREGCRREGCLREGCRRESGFGTDAGRGADDDRRVPGHAAERVDLLRGLRERSCFAVAFRGEER